ncbi:MAG TPA: SMP-30/gluconolactonase/LRE family protein [Vicinamibacterales bacterium]
MTVIAAAAAFLSRSEPARGIDLGASRLMSSQPLQDAMMESCTWDVAAPDLSAEARSAKADRFDYQGPRAGAGGGGASPATGDPKVASRMPVKYIHDPYAGFAAIRVDPVHNDIVVMDEFKFNIYVYDRLATTPASATETKPKRFIGGGKTLSRYNSDGYVDTKTGDIYIINNDSEPGMFVFSRTAEGNVEPVRELLTPYGAFGLTVDEERGEIFLTIQHDGAIQIYKKGAKGEENAVRLIQGNRTRLADPHGIAFDPKTRLLYVANYGTERDEAADTVQQMPNPLNSITPGKPRRPNWPAGNGGPGNAGRREVIFGTGKFGPPSVTVYSADATGNVEPIRQIVGPKAQLNWPTGISVDPDRGEIYVSNAAGDTINVFSAMANGDAAPIRQIKGAKTLLKNPNGVSVDTVNGEVWVANFGNHTATAYKRDANGNAEPVRVIRSAPLDAPTTMISNPYMIAFDGRRDEVLVPNCVAQPRISAFASSADKNAVPTRIIEGQKTLLNRTVHAIAYDEIHDEIVVQSNIGQTVVTYRGGATGDEAPIRIIQGPKTLLRDPQTIFIDPANNEIYALNMGTDDTLLVYDRLAQGDVAPKRVLKSPAAVAGVGAVDPVSNLLFLAGRNNGVLVYNRTAEGATPPLRTIGGGPVSGLVRPGRLVVYPPTHSLVVTTSAGQGARDPVTKDLTPQAYVGVWNEDDSGDVAPRWTIAKGYLYMPRGLTLDPKKKTVIVSDKYKNSVMTFSLPELYDRAASSQTARAN